MALIVFMFLVFRFQNIISALLEFIHRHNFLINYTCPIPVRSFILRGINFRNVVHKDVYIKKIFY